MTLSDKDLFELSATMFHVCLKHLLTIKKEGYSYEAMRQYLATKPHLHPYHAAVLQRVVNEWEEYYVTTGHRYSVSPKQHTVQRTLFLYFLEKLTLGKKRKIKWTFGLKVYKWLKNNILTQSTSSNRSPQKSKSPLYPNQSKPVQTHLDWFGDTQKIDKQLVRGGKEPPVQKSTFFRPF